MAMKRLILSIVAIHSLVYGQNSVSINANEDDLELSGSMDLSQAGAYGEGMALNLDLDLLHTDKDNIFYFGVSGESQVGASGFTLGAGMKTVSTDDYFALPFLLKASYVLPFDETIPTTSLNANIAYAPSVLSFMDADKYMEWRMELDMSITNNLHLFTGYRDIDTDYETHDYNFNNSFYGGLKLNF